MVGRSRRYARPRRAVLLGFLIFGFMPVIILAASSIALSRRTVERDANLRLSAAATTYGSITSVSVQALANSFETVSKDPRIAQALQQVRTRPNIAAAALRDLLGDPSQVHAVYLADAHGNPVATWPSTAKRYSDPTQLDWFQGAARSDHVYVSASYLAAENGNRQSFSLAVRLTKPVTATVPATGPKPVTATKPATATVPVTVGYLMGIYDTQGLRAIVQQLERGFGGRQTIADQAGNVLSGIQVNGSNLVSLADDSQVKAALAGESGVVTVQGQHGKDRLAYAPITSLRWAIEVQQSEDTAYASYFRLRDTVLAITAFLLLVLLLTFIAALKGDARRRMAETAAVRQERELAASEQRFRSAFIHAPVGMVRETIEGTMIEVNLAFCAMLGMTEDQLIGRHWLDITHPDDKAISVGIDARLEDADRSVYGEKRYVRADGEELWALVSVVELVNSDGVPYLLAQVIDISDRKHAEAQLNRQALYDALTGLANRTLVESRIDHALSRLERDTLTDVALLFIDLDGFKDINDRLGHQVGDEALREIALRLQQAVRPGDTVARLGGDEFLVLCEALPTFATEAPALVATRILETINRPGGAGERSWQVSASIGISQPNRDLSTSAELMAAADAAMYRAKQQGKNCVEVYDESLNIGSPVAPRALSLVESAVAQDRLRLYYQPVFDLRTRTVVGAEALLRMIDDDGEVLTPAQFLAAAEAHGQIVAFGAWSVRQACNQAVEWKAQLPAGRDFSVAVNMSVKEMEDLGFLARVDRALAESQLPPDALVIELTESAFMRDLPSGRLAIEGLRARGVKLALDDFGTGFSSLSYLRRFEVDVIKLDRSFVADLLGDRRGALVTRGLIALAQSLQTILLAEGVEDEEQAQALLGLGAYLAQGYLLGKPMPAEQFSRLLAGADVSALSRG